jgi:type I restriction enzyme, S subunit
MNNKMKTASAKVEVMPALVPKVRFPGFSDPWTYQPLSKVLKEHKLKNAIGRDVFSVSMEYGIVNQIEHLGRSYAAADTSHYTIGRRFDVVYTRSPLKAYPFGIVKQCKGDEEVALSPLYGVFTPPNPHLGLMIEAFFESPSRSTNFLSPLCQKGAKNTLQITNTTFLSGRLPLPTQPAEQQKIAKCLSSADKLIAAQARKVDALKIHKKGLLQQLFPIEGKVIPRLRFSEFKSAGAWHRQRISNLLSKVSEPVNVEPNLMYKEIGIRSHGKGIFHKEPISGKQIGSKRVFFVVKDALVLNIVFAWEQAVAMTSIAEEGMIASHRFPMYVALADRCYVNYMKYFFLTNAGKHLLGLASPGGAGRNRTLGQKEFEQLEVTLPQDVHEQMKVADCLSSVDAHITVETQKLEDLKTHKKGLMQQLFPVSEAIET